MTDVKSYELAGRILALLIEEEKTETHFDVGLFEVIRFGKDDTGISCVIRCNDVFWWGCADFEEVTEANFPVLEECIKKTREYGGLLFCAHVRGLRPQGAFYGVIPKELWPLFDEAGPERSEDEPGNTPRPDPTEE